MTNNERVIKMRKEKKRDKNESHEADSKQTNNMNFSMADHLDYYDFLFHRHRQAIAGP